MKVTRIYSNEHGDSCFEDVEISILDAGEIGKLSAPWAARQVIFRETGPDYNYTFHNAPTRQFVIMLDGQVEIETSLGEKRLLGTGYHWERSHQQGSRRKDPQIHFRDPGVICKFRRKANRTFQEKGRGRQKDRKRKRKLTRHSFFPLLQQQHEILMSA